MAEETIVIETTSHSGQVEKPASTPQEPVTPAAPPAPATIAPRTDTHSDQVDKAVWSTAKINDLPNSSFLYIEPGAENDEDGKTMPRSKRHFPYKDASGKVDLPHLRNAIARIPQSNAPGLTPEKKRSLQERARKLLGNQGKEMEEKMSGDGMEMESYPLYGVTSFADLEDLQQAGHKAQEINELTGHFQMMVGNIMHDPGIMNKETALNNLLFEFTARVKQAGKHKEKSNLMGFLRNLFDKPALSDPSFRSRASAAGKEAQPDEDQRHQPVTPSDYVMAKSNSFMVWKEANGQYRWLAVYSNNYRDEDNPPEIISEKSHRAFLDLVDSGVVEYPELWHWHIPGTRWGKADMLDYADGFAIASGTVDAGHEDEAKALSQMGDIRVSHGMPSRFIVRNKEDSSVIDFHITAEISDLPGFAAANRLTEFVVLKEYDMALSPDKKDYLRKAGLDDGAISEIEKNLADKAKAAQQAGLESKETTPAETPVADTEAPAYVTAQEVAAAVGSLVKPLTDALNAVTQQLGAVQAEIKALKVADEEKVAKAAQGTPRASLEALMAQTIFGSSDAQVDGRTTLAKAGPKQAPSTPDTITGFEYIDQMIARSRAEVTQ